MSSILLDIVNKSGRTRDDIAAKLGLTRQGLHLKLKNPKGWTVADLEKFGNEFNRSPRNLFSLIINN
jgi:hypothetical protein